MKFCAKSCKIMQNRAAKVKMIQKRASQGFLDPIQKRALSRSVQLEAVYLEALLYARKLYNPKMKRTFEILRANFEKNLIYPHK